MGTELKIGMINCSTSLEGVPFTEHDLFRRRDKPLETLLGVVSNHDSLDILLAPEWFFMSQKGVYRTEDYNYIKRLIEEASSRAPNMLILPGTIAWVDDDMKYRNTCPVIWGGRTIVEYSKKEVEEEKSTSGHWNAKPVPGEEKGVFDWKGSSVGIEICKDNYDSTLKKEGFTDLDMQIVISSGLPELKDETIVVKDGGLLILCDGGGEFLRKRVRQIRYYRGNMFQHKVDENRRIRTRKYHLVTFSAPYEARE